MQPARLAGYAYAVFPLPSRIPARIRLCLRQLLRSGFPATEQIAVPAKRNSFLRLGIRDLGGDRICAIEIPVDQVKLGAGGPAIPPLSIYGAEDGELRENFSNAYRRPQILVL